MLSKFKVSKKELLCILLPAVMLASLMLAGPVFADSETTPDAAAAASADTGSSTQDENTPVQSDADTAASDTQAVDTAASEVSGADAASQETVVDSTESESQDAAASVVAADETTTSTTDVVDSSTSTTEASTANEDLSNAAAALAENNVVMVDESGTAVDLASQESTETISSSDPWWVVGATKYAYVKTGGTCPSGTTAGVTCFESDTPISSALAYMDLQNLVPSDGILHVEADSYTEDVTVDGSSGNLSTLKGIVSSGTSSNTQITGTVTISNTTQGFTLIGLTIIGQLQMTGNVGTITLSDVTVKSSSGTGVTITNHKGAVVADQVSADKNTTYGMYVDNTAGTGAVTITNSEFSHNDDASSSTNYAGLYIQSNGVVTLDGISASDNAGNGVEIAAAKSLVVSDSTFNNNTIGASSAASGHGLYVNNGNALGTVTLTNVQADNNSMSGIYVITKGNITLTNVNAYNNGTTNAADGVYLNNTSGKGTVTVNSSAFQSSGAAGLSVVSNSTVAMNGITAEENSGNGVTVDTCNLSGATCLGSGVVGITGSMWNLFNNNGGYGLYVLSAGNVSLANFTADGNANGVYIKNDYTGKTGKVTINQSYTSDLEDYINTISNNTDSGLKVYSNGNISIAKLESFSNGGSGAVLDNDTSTISGTVSVQNAGFYSNAADGLQISSLGTVTIYNVDAYLNGGNGLAIDGGTSGRTINVTSPRTGSDDFYDNDGYGVYITSAGLVTLSGIKATGNGYGAYVDNTAGTSKYVNIYNSDFSGSTLGNGLTVLTKGLINLVNATSSSNKVTGIVLDNSAADTAQKIYVSRVTASNNTTGSGLVIDSLGMIILENVTLDSNALYGADIDNCQYDSGSGTCKGTTGVKMQGDGNEFSKNGGTGLSILTSGSVSMTNVSADNNQTGLSIDSAYTKSVKISNAKGYTNSFSNNDAYGIYIVIPGNITLAGVNASSNTGSGVYLDNTSGTASSSINLINSVANENLNQGFYLLSLGNVILNGAQADENTNYGIYINNSGTGASGNVIVTTNATTGIGIETSGNGKQGFYVLTNGNINLTKVDVSGNGISGTDGAYLDNSNGGFTKVIVLKNASFDDNNQAGVEIISQGTISWVGGSASGNDDGSGASITNADAALARTVTISGVEFNQNTSDGLIVTSLGTITLGSVTADENGGSGANLDNCLFDSGMGTCTGSGNIVIQSSVASSFNGNSAIGLAAYTTGNITVVNFKANDNDSQGLYLTNQYSNSTGNIVVKTGDKSTYNEVSGNGNIGLNILTNGSVLVSQRDYQ